MFIVRGKIQSSYSVNSRCCALVALGFLVVPVAVAAATVPKAPYFSLISAQAVFSALPPQTPVKSKIEQELDKSDSNKKTTGVTKTKNTRAGHTRSSARRTAQPVQFPITFISDVPGVEIAVDDTVVGRTKEDRRLTVKIKKGQYKATASLKGYNSQSIPVAVFGERTYALNLGKPIPAPNPTPTLTVKPEPTPEPVMAVQPPPPSVDEIIKRFIDPRETSKVTVAEWQEVITQSEAGMKSEPASVQAAARLHLGQGQLRYLNKEYAESVSEFNHAISALPLSGIAYYGLGNAYLATNQPLEASKAYQRAIALTPNVAALAHKGMGDALTQLHKPKEANAYYQRARGLGDLSPDINKGIALNLMAGKQWRKALSELEAIEGSDSSAERYLSLGECYENLKRPLNAYQSFLKATQMDPNSALAFAKLGDVLFLQRDFPAADDAYERALALDPGGNKINRQLVRKRANAAASHAKK